jgi:hypothetical protein
MYFLFCLIFSGIYYGLKFGLDITPILKLLNIDHSEAIQGKGVYNINI